MTSWATRMMDSILKNYPRSEWKWHYEHGLLVKAVQEVSRVTGKSHYEQFARDWVDNFVTPDGRHPHISRG